MLICGNLYAMQLGLNSLKEESLEGHMHQAFRLRHLQSTST